MAARHHVLLIFLAGAACAAGCRSNQQMLKAHESAIVSLAATAAMAGDAWLSGDVSQTYTRMTLERSEQLLAQQRDELSSDIELLATDQGAAMSEAEDQLSRTLASLYKAVDGGDAATARRRLDDLRSRPGHR
jgi:hypothetical protein